MFRDALQADLHTTHFISLFNGATGTQGLIETHTEGDGSGVADGLVHPNDIINVPGNGLGLGFGITGIQYHALDLRGELLEQSGQGLRVN